MRREETKAQRQVVAPEVERIASLFVDAAFQVHKRLGPGLPESVYQTCLEHELIHRGLRVRSQAWFPVKFGNLRIDHGCRVDLVVEDCLIIELKSVDQILPAHRAQIRGYLRHAGYPLGFLVNFNVALFKEGIVRMLPRFFAPSRLCAFAPLDLCVFAPSSLCVLVLPWWTSTCGNCTS
jgi:GxxExxY protein